MSSDPILGTMAYPCDMCGAKSGEECQDTCPGLTDEPWQLPDPDPGPALPDIYSADYVGGGTATMSELAEAAREQSKSDLMAAVYRLPFAAFLPDPPDRREYGEGEWLARLATWMTDYQARARSEIDRLQADSRRAISLQIQQDAARAWLQGSTR